MLCVGLLIISLLVTACGKPEEEVSAPEEEVPAEVAEEEAEEEVAPIDIAFFVPWTEDVWYVAAIAGAQAQAEKLNVNLEVYDAGYKVETQVQQFDTAMVSNPDAIVLSSVDPAAMVPSVERAHEAGIIMVDYDRPLWETEALDALLILDTPGLGTIGGQAIIDYLTEKHGEPKGKIIRAFGDLADTWVTDISEGWDPLMEGYPDIEVLSAMSGPWEPEEAAANVEQLLVTNPDVDAIFLDSDWLGSGIVAYLEASGEYGKVGEDNHIYFVGVGGMPQALDYMREGWMDVTINNPVPDFAAAAIDVAAMLVRGEELPSEYVQEGAGWSPAKIHASPDYGTLPFPSEEKPYKGPVMNMQNVLVGIDDVDDPNLWGNMAGEEEVAEEEVAPIDIAFFVPWTEDVWYVAAIAGAQAQAEKLNVNLEVYDAGYKVETQVQQFDTAMVSNPDAIVLSSVDPAAMVPSVERAHEAGIIMVDYDRPLWETEALDALLILDTPGLGTIGGQAIIDYLTEKHGEPKGKIIRAFGDLADTWVTDISEGWDPLMEGYPDIEVLSAMSGPWEPEEAAANVEQLLVTNPDVDAIFLDSDWLGSGIVAYLEASGEYGKVGEDNHIYFVGVGGMPQALDYMREGWMDVTINNPVPDFAAAAIDVAAMLVRGEELPSEYVQEGAGWSPAKIHASPDYGTLPFPSEEKPYKGPVMNMQNVLVGIDDVDDPNLWGNMTGE